MPTWADPNSVQNPTSGATIQSALLDQIRDDLMVLRQPKFALANNGFEMISDTTVTTVTFANQDYDTAAMFTPGDQHITVPETGLYVVTATAEWDAVVGGRRQLEVEKNAMTSLGHVTGPAGAGGDCAQAITVPLQEYNGGDQIEVRVYQDSGVSVQVLVAMSVEMRGTL